MSIECLKDAKKAIGAKQTSKAIERGGAKIAFIASDADDRVTRPIRELCQQKGVTLEVVPTMLELGKACGIEVGAAAAAAFRE